MLPLLLLPLLWAGSLQEDPRYKLQLQESVTVQAGLCALVSCSFSYPGGGRNPPSKLYISWFRDEGSAYYYGPVATNHPDRNVRPETRGRFHLLGDARDNNCSLLIRDARMRDTGRYFLTAEIGWSTKHIYGDKTLTLRVTALTEKPVIHFLEPLESGRPTSLSCRLPGSCEGGRPLLFSWTGAVTDSMDPGALQSSVLSLTPRPQDHDTNLTCRVELQGAGVTTERTVQLNVSYAPQNLSVRIFFRNSTALLEGQALLLCYAQDSNPAAQLSWFRGPPTQNASRVSDTGVLDLSGAGAAEGEAFTCRAQNALGSRNVSVSLSYPPRLLGPSCSREAAALRCRCSSRARPAPALHWRLGEGLLEGNSSNASLSVASSSAGPWANSSLSLHGALSSGLRLSCEARNAHGTRSATVLLLPGKSGPGAVLAALGGAGAGALLSLCLCLIFFCIVKSYRKHRTEKLADMDNKDPVMGTVTWGPRQKSCRDSPGDQACPAGGALPGEQQELHYASLSFHGTPPGRQATSSTEYSEIKPSK